MLEILISFILVTITLAIFPGPDNIFVLTQSMLNGKKHGLATVVGLMAGCVVHTTLVAFGVSEVIKQNPSLFFSIKLFGTIYLLYLAYQVYKSDTSITFSTKNIQKKTILKLFKTGFWMNVLNPKVTIFFLAFFPQFLFSDNTSNIVQFYVLGGLFILTSFVVFSSIALLAGNISNYLKQNNKIGSYLKWMQIAVFVFIAGWILV